MKIKLNDIRSLSSSEKKTLFFMERNININNQIHFLKKIDIGERAVRRNLAKFIKMGILTRFHRNGDLTEQKKYQIDITENEIKSFEIELSKLEFNYNLLKELSGNELHLLLAIYNVGGKRTNRFLSEYTGMSIRTVVRCLNKLSKQKFVIKIINYRLEGEAVWDLKLVTKRVLKYEKYKKSNKTYLYLEKLGLNLKYIDNFDMIKDLNYVDSSFVFKKSVVECIEKIVKSVIKERYSYRVVTTLDELDDFIKRSSIIIRALVAIETKESIFDIDTYYKFAIKRKIENSMSKIKDELYVNGLDDLF